MQYETIYYLTANVNSTESLSITGKYYIVHLVIFVVLA